MRLLFFALLLAACSKQREEPEFDPNDRALQKLMAEKERLAKHPPPPRPAAGEPNPLAEIAAAPSRPESLGIPNGANADLGPVKFTLVEVKQSQTFGNGKVSLSTEDRFLQVQLDATSSKAAKVDLTGAELQNGDEHFAIARDVQRVAGGTALTFELDPGKTVSVVLLFEVPPSVIRKGLTIVLTEGQSRVELPLQ